MPRKTVSKKPIRPPSGRTCRVRIIAGRWRGRWLAFDNENGLRPTGDRIRETVFNWLQTRIPGSRCLDLFAGSGALGIEAASRFATSVTLVERNPRVVTRLRAEIEKLAADAIEVVQASALEFLDRCASAAIVETERFDLVFIDPPFDNDSQLATLKRCVKSGVLRDGARVYLEAPASASIEAQLPGDFSVLKLRQAGKVQYCLLEYSEQPTD